MLLRYSALSVLCLLLLSNNTLLLANPSAKKQRTLDITADRMQYSKTKKIFNLHKNIVIRSGDIVISSQKMNGVMHDDGGRIKSLHFPEKVKISNIREVIVADRADYFVDQAYIELTGNITRQSISKHKIDDHKKIITDNLIYDLKTGQLRSGKQGDRKRVTIY